MLLHQKTEKSPVYCMSQNNNTVLLTRICLPLFKTPPAPLFQIVYEGCSESKIQISAACGNERPVSVLHRNVVR
jgi:hypothetical protein